MIAAQGRSLGDYVAVLKRRKVSFAIGVLLALIFAAGYLALAERTYVSSAKILVQDAASDTMAERSRTTDSVNLDTEAQVVTSLEVAELAEESLGTGMPLSSLARRVTVTVPPNTTVLDITYRASDPAAAQAGAQAFASAYLDYRLQSTEGVLDEQTARVRAELNLSSAELTSVIAELETDGGSAADVAALRSQRTLLITRLEALNTRLASLRSVVAGAGRVINDAQRPNAPTTPNLSLVIPAALFSGLLLGMALALWREAKDLRVHGASDLVRLFGLAPVAELDGMTEWHDGSPVQYFDAGALYQTIRSAGPPEGQVVTALAPGVPEVGEAVSRSLVEVAARSRASSMHISAATQPELAARLDGVGTLTTATFADYGAQADGQVDAGRLQQVISSLRQKYDFTVVGLPTHSVGDVLLVARSVDVALVVVQLGVTTRRSIEDSLRGIRAVGDADVFMATVKRTRRRDQKPRKPRRSSRPSSGQSDARAVDPSPAPGESAPSRQAGGRPSRPSASRS